MRPAQKKSLLNLPLTVQNETRRLIFDHPATPKERRFRRDPALAFPGAERVWHSSQSIRTRSDETVELKLKVAINPEFEAGFGPGVMG
jgi:hypothetical protein